MRVNLVESLLEDGLDDILSVREDLGAALAAVSIVTRTWDGTQIGDGSFTDTVEEMHPAPRVVNYSHSLRVMTGGAVEQGDLLLKMISKETYPLRTDIDCSSTDLVEKFYRLNEIDYRVISIVEKHVTWNVQVRRLSDQARRA